MRNNIADILQKIGFGVFIIGFVGGIFLANDDIFNSFFSSDFVWSIAIITWVDSFICGMLFIGFAEIIELQNSQLSINEKNNNLNREILAELQKLNSKIEKKQEIFNTNKDYEQTVLNINNASIDNVYKTNENPKQENSDSTNEEVHNKLIDVSDTDFRKIRNNYPNNKLIERITQTPFENIYLVFTSKNRELIRYFGFMPNILSDSEIKEISGLREWYEKNC